MNFFVQVSVPLTNSDDIFRSYRIKTYPIPLQQNEYAHITQVENIPENVAISVTKGVHLPITNDEWQDFHIPNQSLIQRIFRPMEAWDCVIAIFLEDKTKIKTNCIFSIVLQSIQPAVSLLFENTFLL